MKKDRVRAHCPRCRHQQVFVQATINHPLHAVLSIITGGLWLVSWIALTIGKYMRPWRCEHCGWHKPEFVEHTGAVLGKPAKTANAAHGRNRRPDRSASITASQTGPIRV